MAAIQNIDYNRLAELSESYHIPFHKLCQRAEKGEDLEKTLTHPSEWVDYHQAAKIAGVTYQTFASSMTSPLKQLEYWGIRWKSLSKNNPLSKRGCGVLFNVEDLKKIHLLRQITKKMAVALRLLEAERLGQLNIEFS
jgi:hypothetical protein